jgi:hypothetical protein
LLGVLEAVALAGELEDLQAVGEPIEGGVGKTLRAEDLSPMLDGEVGGDDEDQPHISLTAQVKQEFGADSFSVVLDRQPTGDAVVNLTTSDTAVATVDPTRLRFTPIDWSKPKAGTPRGGDSATANPDRTVQVVVSVTPTLPAAV